MARLTTLVLVFNEQQRIARCIKSLLFTDRLVIVDSFSTDATLPLIAKTWRDAGRLEQDLVIISRTWEGFSRTRQWSLDNWVKTPWALWIDADEWVSQELAHEITHVAQSNEPQHVVYRMPRLSYFLGRPIRYGGWYPDRKARLGLVGRCHWQVGPRGADVHEDLVATDNQSPGLLNGHLYHEPFLNRDEQNDTNRRYSALLAQGQARLRHDSRAGKYSPLTIGIKVAIKFAENFLLKRGVLDGKPGLLIALGSAKSLYWRLTQTNVLLDEPRPKDTAVLGASSSSAPLPAPESDAAETDALNSTAAGRLSKKR